MLKLGLVMVLGLLIACTPKPPKQPTAGDEIYHTLENGVYTDQVIGANSKANKAMNLDDALLPPLAVKLPEAKAVKEHRFNVAAKEVPAKSFFMSLVAGTPYNMLVDPAAQGTITLELKNVTIDETLDAVRELYGYEYQRTSTGYEIIPPVMKTQIFTVNYLDVQRKGNSRTDLVPTQISNSNVSSGTSSGSSSGSSSSGTGDSATGGNSGSSVQTQSNYDFWKSLAANLKILIGTKDGRWVITNPQASTVMVHAYPRELHQVADYLDHIQKSLQRQVVIEAKVLEVRLSAAYKAGIDWTVFGADQAGLSDSSFTPSGGNFFSVSLSGYHGDFKSVINLLESQGNVQVLSSPHVSTVNNQTAVIKVGEDEFFVTGYTSNVTPSGSSNTTSQSVSLTPFFSGITLDVTPQISSQGEIILYIHPAVSTVKDQTKTISLGDSGDLTLPLAQSTIRESDSIVHARSGQIIVLGGLMQHRTEEQINATPGLNKIPFAGALARNTEQATSKSELVILLKPIVVDDSAWTNELQNSANRVRELKRGFHFGGLPQQFGTEAEKNP